MKEQEWLVSQDPAAMMRFLTRPKPESEPYRQLQFPSEFSDRKLRLFACANSRQVWHLLTDPRSRKAVEMAERYANLPPDRQAKVRPSLAKYADRAEEVKPLTGGSPHRAAMWCALPVIDLSMVEVNVSAHISACRRADLLHCIAGNPFRAVAIDPAWLTPDVRMLAEAAYEERKRKCEACNGTGVGGHTGDYDQWIVPCRECGDGSINKGTIDDGTLDPDRLAVLSDALEEAGMPSEVDCGVCDGLGWVGKIAWTDKPDLSRPCPAGCTFGRSPHPALAHLRSPGPHYCGCHVVDAILGRE